MAAWTLQDVLGEIQASSSLWDARKKRGKEECLQKGLLKNILFKIQSLKHLGAAEALKIQEAVAASAFPEAMQDEILTQVEELMATTQAVETCKNVSLKPQTLVHIQEYLTASDWEALENDSDSGWFTKQKVLVQRLHSLGIRSMSEMTCKYAVSLLLCTLSNLPAWETLHDTVVDFKNVFHSSGIAAAQDLPYVHIFPDNPKALPDSLFQSAYAKEQPEARKVDKLAMVARVLPMRSTKQNPLGNSAKKRRVSGSSSSSQLSNEPSNLLPTQPQQQLASGMQGMEPMMTMMTMMMQACKKAVENGSPSKPGSSAAGAMSFQPKQKQLHALEDKKPEGSYTSPHKASAFKEIQEDPEEPGSEEDVATEEPLAASGKDSLEKRLFDTLKKNKEEKKVVATGKAKAKAKAKGKSMKKPAAHGCAAAGSKQSKYEVPPPTKEQLKARRESYTDMHYHKARLLAKNAGKTEEDCKVWGRAARATAAQLWAESSS